MKRIHLISGPRNLSTALMYSFAHRSDTQVVDEPLYAHYLRLTDKDHPGKEEVLQSMDSDWNRVVEQVILGDYEKSILFIKGMAHHLQGGDLTFLTMLDNLFLIRNPKQLICSFAQVIPYPDMTDIGLERQVAILHFLQKEHKNAVVLDSGELLKDPPQVMRRLCEALQIPFEEGMLQWAPGPIPQDGVWAKYWYENVHRSSGFQKQQEKERKLPEHLIPLYEEAMPYYQELFALSIKA